jgi:thiosulfate dehydrogenase
MYNRIKHDKALVLTEKLISIIKLLVLALVLMVTLLVSFIIFSLSGGPSLFNTISEKTEKTAADKVVNELKTLPVAINFWKASDITTLGNSATDETIKYGKELIANTSKYLGPKGSVMQTTNGLNCQNCHLEAGTKVFGNNYGAVYANYPEYRTRSGKEEDIYKRVNDCMEHSLNGKPLTENSKEMQAIKAYIEWLGNKVAKEVVCHGPGINLLHSDKTKFSEKIKQFTAQGIIFVACENTLKEKQIAKEKILPEAAFVLMGIGEIVKKQEQGWSYIKAGF